MRKIKIINREQGTGYRKKADLTPEPRTLTPERGFTLIELLLAASILGMISLAVLSTFGTGMRAFERVQSFGTRQADVLLFLESWERDLRNTFALSQIKFEGDAGQMSFAGIGTKFEETEDGEGREITFLGKKSYYFDDSRNVLVSEERNYAEAASADVQSQEIPVTGVQFQYYFYRETVEDEKEHREYGWQGTWSEAETIPKGVKVAVTFQDGDREVSLVRTVFVPSGGDIGETQEEEQEDGDGQGDA